MRRICQLVVTAHHLHAPPYCAVRLWCTATAPLLDARAADKTTMTTTTTARVVDGSNNGSSGSSSSDDDSNSNTATMKTTMLVQQQSLQHVTATVAAAAQTRAVGAGNARDDDDDDGDEGISRALGGVGVYAGSVTAFVKPSHARRAEASTGASSSSSLSMSRPCVGTTMNTATYSSLPQLQRRGCESTRSTSDKSTAKNTTNTVTNATSTTTTTSTLTTPTPPTPPTTTTQPDNDAQQYYKHLAANAVTKEEMWSRIRSTHAAAEQPVPHDTPTRATADVDFLKLRTELKEHDLFHYRLGTLAFADVPTRRDYYAVWSLAMSLNRARWTMLEVRAQRGVSTTGAGVKLLFWREAVQTLLDHRGSDATAALRGQFTDSHPVLRPFAAMLQRRRATLTRAFVRGFTEARLRPVQQPGNVAQLLEHFDKFYGYLYNTVLQAIGIHDEAAEHMLHHMGRATGLTTHCVLYWKKYAKLGTTLLPADVCADHCVNLALLQNTALAARDRAVRRVLYEMLCIAKHEMLHAQRLVKDVTPLAWPVLAECWHTNYYLYFLQRRDYNVSALFADFGVENPSLWWFYAKKMWQWRRQQSVALLVDDAAPLPLLGVTAWQRGSKYASAGSSKKGDESGGSSSSRRRERAGSTSATATTQAATATGTTG